MLLGNVEDCTSGVPLEVAVERIDPTRSNPYVQANAVTRATRVEEVRDPRVHGAFVFRSAG